MQQFLLYCFLAPDSTVTFLWVLKIIKFLKKERKKEGRKKRKRTKKGTGENGTGKKIITKMHNEISSHYQSWKWQKTTSLCYFSWSWSRKTENVARCRTPQSHTAQAAIGDYKCIWANRQTHKPQMRIAYVYTFYKKVTLKYHTYLFPYHTTHQCDTVVLLILKGQHKPTG